jgi:1,4-dihydroxy-2-naphthoate polyprenyltransferase
MGLLTPRQVWTGAAISFGIAALCGIPLILHGGALILVIGIMSVICGYAYTSGPFPLAYNGLGEVFVILFFGVVAVVGSYFLQAGAFSTTAILLGIEIGLLAAALIAVNNYRDLEGDREAGKRTLAARFGPTFARFEVAVFLLLPFVIHVIGGFRSASWILLLSPFALFIIVRLWKSERGRSLNPILGMVANFELLYAIVVVFTLR